MAARSKRTVKRAAFRAAAGVLGLLALSLATPASAEGLFDRIFSGLRQAIEGRAHPPANVQAYVDPSPSMTSPAAPQSHIRTETGPAKAFCVRTCDGHFFPVQARAGLSAAESCHAFCPASQTRLYSGGNIDGAVASDGSRYADLDNAFVYRRQLVNGCTCNGRDQFGLARMDVKSDPTLRPGDIVATKTGLMAFTGMKDKVADFTPIDSYHGVSQNTRDKLSDVRIMPPNPGAAEATKAIVPTAADRTRDNDRRRAQLAR